MTNSLSQGKSTQSSELQQNVRHTYQLITSSRYVTNRHLEQISIDTLNRIVKMNCSQPWRCHFDYVQGVFALTTNATYDEYERRFSYFYHAMISKLIEQFQEISHVEHDQYIEYLMDLLTNNTGIESPWSTLLFRLSNQIETDQLKGVYTVLSNSIDPATCSRSLALTYSYVALFVDKEVTALTAITKNDDQFEEQEVSPHFELLKEGKRWRTMKHWVHILFPQKRNGRFGSLQPFIDEMNSALSVQPKEQADIWNRWLLSPSYQRFLTYTKHLSEDEQLNLVEWLLPKLEPDLSRLETAKTYEQLLLHSKKYDLAMQYLLDHERDPLRLRIEKEELLHALRENRPDLARPIYHQFIVRLIEKKSRVHYEQAAISLKTLQSLYKTDEERALFNDYIGKIKKMYRTYRAFIEELKQIDL